MKRRRLDPLRSQQNVREDETYRDIHPLSVHILTEKIVVLHKTNKGELPLLLEKMAPGWWGYWIGHHSKGGFCGKDSGSGGQLSCHPAESNSRTEEKREVNTVQSHVGGADTSLGKA